MSRFVSNQKDFRVFLREIESGGAWADFSPNGEYTTDNKENVESLLSKPNYKRDYYLVTPLIKAEYKCPETDCEYTADKAKKVVGHVRALHHKRITVEDVIIVRE